MTEVLVLALSVTELESVRTLLISVISAMSARLLTHVLHEGSVAPRAVSRVLPSATVAGETVLATADVAGFGAVGAHVSVVVLTLASVGPLFAAFVLVDTGLVTAVVITAVVL